MASVADGERVCPNGAALQIAKIKEEFREADSGGSDKKVEDYAHHKEELIRDRVYVVS